MPKMTLNFSGMLWLYVGGQRASASTENLPFLTPTSCEA